MHRFLLVLTVAGALVASAVAVPAGSAVAATFSACSGGYNPDGSVGTFYTRIRAKRVTCAAARTVVRRWVSDHRNGTGNPTAASDEFGYTCRGRSVVEGHDREGLAILCVRGRKAVSFFGHP